MRRAPASAAVAAVVAISTAIFACAPNSSEGPLPAPPAHSGGSRSDESLGRRLAGIDTRLAEISARMDAQAVAMERVSTALRELSESLQKDRRGGPSVGRDARERSLLPEKNVGVLGQLRGWASDSTVRARWMFSSAESVASTIGIPDSVGQKREYETWTYEVPARGNDDAEYWELWFLNGQLVDCDGPGN